MLVLEDAIQDQKLLAAAVCMCGEAAARCVADDRSGARDLIADAIEHAPLDTWDRRRHPGEARGVDGGSLREVCIKVHAHAHYAPGTSGRIALRGLRKPKCKIGRQKSREIRLSVARS